MKKVKKNCPRCFSIIKAPARTKIIQKLRKSPHNVKKILECFSLTQPTVSYHLKVLQEHGILYSKKQGREIYYFLNKKYPCKNCSLLNLPLKI